jgi:hypothetical protein
MIDETTPLHTRFEHLLSVIRSERFLKKMGLGNEVPFFICPYQPEDENNVRRMVKQLIGQLSQVGVIILHIDLYDLSIEILHKRGIWDRVLQTEQKVSKAQLKELLQGVLDPENHLIPAIREKMDAGPFDVLFISGVGEVFPYIRSHNVLNNLQSAATEKPTLMFFPGKYTHSIEGGASLDLFGRLHDDKYYRAFNIYHYEV